MQMYVQAKKSNGNGNKKPRNHWTDKKLDDEFANIDQRFDAIDKRFDKIEQQLTEIKDLLIGFINWTKNEFTKIRKDNNLK